MSCLRIEVRGCGESESLERAAIGLSIDVEFTFRQDYSFTPASNDRSPEGASVFAADAVLCFVEKQLGVKLRESLRFVRTCIDLYPYVPVVVVGVSVSRLRSFTVLGPARVLPPGASATWILAQAVAAVQATWWWSAQQIDAPLMIVDQRGTILRVNEAASNSLGRSLIGRPYRTAVERADSPELPEGHPLRDVFESGVTWEASGGAGLTPAVVCRYIEYPMPGVEAGRAQLACMPILGLKNRLRAVAVLFVDMNSWTRTILAASGFVRHEGIAELCRDIVEEVKKLGYSRARLYEYDEQQGTMVGRASIGLSSSRAEYFRHGFCIDISNDRPSAETIHREFPRLCFHQDIRHVPEEGTELYGTGFPWNHKEELELEGVNRWIEVPLRVPIIQANGTTDVRCWGKLSVDRGRDSDRLDVRDVANIALFANMASAAIGMVAAREAADRNLELFRSYSQRVLATVWQAPTEEVKLSVIDLLMELCLEFTGADVAFFRQLSAGALRLDGTPKWRGPAPEGVRVPSETRRGEIGSAKLLNLVDTEGRLLETQTAFPAFVFDHQSSTQEVIKATPEGRWDGEELQFLQRVGSQFCIPLVVQSTLRGVIVAGSWDHRVFPVRSHLALKRFVYTASLWFAFAELRDSRFWSGKTLGEVISVLSELAGAETDERLYAGLAAILSVHCGIGWNRVLIFDCQGPVPNVAQLVYALGGLGNPDHLDVINQVKSDFNDLRALVKTRLKDPVPHGRDLNSQTDRTDALYANFVQNTGVPRVSAFAGEVPVRIRFGPDASTQAGQWLKRVLLETRHVDHAALAMPWSPEDPSFQELRDQYPGLLCNVRAHLFPIWDVLNSPRQKPLAFVVVDNPYRTDHPAEEMLLLTRAVLDLVGNIMMFRNNGRVVSGCIGALPTFAHHTGLKDRWDMLYPDLDRLLIRLREVAEPTGIATAGQIRRLQAALEEVRVRLERVCEDQKILRDRLRGRDPARSDPKIPDLGEYLDRVAEVWERITPGLRFERCWLPTFGIQLDCDPYPLEGVLRCLLDNAVTASRELHPTDFRVTLRADLEPWPGDPSRQFAVIRITDTGAGIPPEARTSLFIEDFTFRKGQSTGIASSGTKPARHTGLGLSIARTLAAACHGDLQVEEFGQPADPHTGAPAVGATFTFRVCVVSKTI